MKTLSYFSILVLFLTTGLEVSGQNLHTRQAPLPCLNKKFTIVAHIVRDSLGNLGAQQADILTDVDSLNLAFEPICVSFEVCEFRIIENFQYDTLTNNEFDELQNQYNVQNRINMYFVNSTDDPLALCGQATQNGIGILDSGGIVILKECVGQRRAMPHEMGHYFGLLHTFEEEGAELVDGTNCETVGDLICDTPADPYEHPRPVTAYVSEEEGCRFISNDRDANGEFYEPDVGNYMSHYPNSCACGFTYDQYVFMANSYLATDPRMW
ncbi:MAG: M43 family zinc metalloprotease [Bacteroidota bacterium]